MEKARILLVEDDKITGKIILNGLEGLGYHVYGPVSTGEEAVEYARIEAPDLILMDIGLDGKMDGIEASKLIVNMYDIPIIFLTADDKSETIERAKISGSFGYIIKPFKIIELHSSIQMAIYRNKADKIVKESRQWLDITLKSIGEAVIATDENLGIKFMNKTAEKLTGWSEYMAAGKSLEMICNVSFDEDGNKSNPSIRDIITNEFMEEKHLNALLIPIKGIKIYIDFNISPIKDDKKNIFGYVCVFKDISEKFKLQSQLQRNIEEAAVFQKKLIPTEMLRDADFSIEAKYIPSQNVGGDLYDFYRKGDFLIMFMADVCGHGVPAAMISAYLKAEFRQYVCTSNIIEPDMLLNRIRDDIRAENLLEGKFVTAIICQIDLKSMTLKYSNAGHCPILLCRNNNILELDDGEEIIIANYNGSDYRRYEFKLEKGDTLLLYTDGIYEWMEDKKIFGLDNLKRYLKNNNFELESINQLIYGIEERKLIQDDISYILINL